MLTYNIFEITPEKWKKYIPGKIIAIPENFSALSFQKHILGYLVPMRAGSNGQIFYAAKRNTRTGTTQTEIA